MAALRHFVLLVFVLLAALFVPGAASAKLAGSSVMSETRAAAEHRSDLGLRWGPGEIADSLLAAKEGVNVGEVVTKPESLWGKSADEIAAGFKEAGYEATVRTSRSGKAQIVTVSGHPEVSQIQVHPGGGRHGGAYVKISTTTEGKIKVVDTDTYKPTPGEKTRVIPFRGGQR